MVEAIQCPSCQTRYGLRPARVRTGLRRAQCFRCGDVFQIEPEVKRLLGILEPASTANVPLAALADAIHQAPEYTETHTPSLEASDLALGDLEIPEQEEETSDKGVSSPTDTAPILSMARTATLPMAEASMENLPEPAMADLELPSLHEPTAAAAAAESVTDETQDLEPSGTYASAREAIARLFGDTPMAPSPTANLRNALDMEAGMEALDNTLGGVSLDVLSTKPFAAPATNAAAEAIAKPMEAFELPNASPTLRMSAAEVASAAGSVVSNISLPPEITQEEVTMVLPPPPSAAPMDPMDPSALRLRIGDQIYGGLDLPTIAKWIEEGRVLEDHQVARGMSESWMDASKVPALRPVFERLRRARLGEDSMPPPPGVPDTGQLKRGLFGGMFGKKE